MSLALDSRSSSIYQQALAPRPRSGTTDRTADLTQQSLFSPSSEDRSLRPGCEEMGFFPRLCGEPGLPRVHLPVCGGWLAVSVGLSCVPIWIQMSPFQISVLLD